MGKAVQNSNKSYLQLKSITDDYYSGKIEKDEAFQNAYDLLLKYKIKLRQKDGNNPTMTISIPQSCEAIVIGVRYTKKSGRNTEDHFLFRLNQDLYKCKGKELGRICPEYKGAHELQLNII